MVITPTLSYASSTWTLPREHERMIRSTQRKMLRFIVQTRIKFKQKTQTSKNEKDAEDEKINHTSSDDETEEGISSNTDCDQDSDVSSSASQTTCKTVTSPSRKTLVKRLTQLKLKRKKGYGRHEKKHSDSH